MKILSRNFKIHSLLQNQKSEIYLLLASILLLIILLNGCSQKQTEAPAKDSIAKSANSSLNSDEQFQHAYTSSINSQGHTAIKRNSFSLITFSELLQARAATAKYRDLEKAKADSFVDINVVVPNMGYHFMKSRLVNKTFEIKRPEILVYNKNSNGHFDLVAVEYAVPLSETPDAAPEGFTGSADVWERNTVFDLWLLHAWIWEFNPDGIFHDTNPLVELLQ